VTKTGSSLAPIVIPIVVMFSLAAWIVMVFHVASHPPWRDRSTAVPQNTQPRQIQRVPAVTPSQRRRSARRRRTLGCGHRGESGQAARAGRRRREAEQAHSRGGCVNPAPAGPGS